MHRGSWKREERRIAKMFHTERTPLSGGNSRHTTSDTLSLEFYVESKLWKDVPFWKLFYEEIVPEAKKENKIPILIVKKKGSPQPMRLFIMKQEDVMRVAKGI
jgi:hypothetical protein